MRFVAVLFALAISGSCSSPPKSSPLYPSRDFRFDVRCDQGIADRCHDFQFNFDMTSYAIRDFADRRLGGVLANGTIRVVVRDSWPKDRYSSRSHSSVEFFPCRHADSDTMRRDSWLCGAAFELTMMLAECGDRGGYCADEHKPGWSGLKKQTSKDLNAILQGLSWSGDDVTIGGSE